MEPQAYSAFGQDIVKSLMDGGQHILIPGGLLFVPGTGVVVLYQLPSPLVRGTNAFNLKLDASALRILVISTSLVRVPYRGRW